MSEKKADISFDGYFQALESGDISRNPYLKFFQVKIGCIEPGKAILKMDTDSRYHQGGGLVQGGLIAALSDEAMANALLRTLADGEITATVDIHHSHLRPVVSGEIMATGEVVKKGKTIAFLKGEVSHNGKVVLTSTATFIIQKSAK